MFLFVDVSLCDTCLRFSTFYMERKKTYLRALQMPMGEKSEHLLFRRSAEMPLGQGTVSGRARGKESSPSAALQDCLLQAATAALKPAFLNTRSSKIPNVFQVQS